MARDIQSRSLLGTVDAAPDPTTSPEKAAVERLMSAIERGDTETAAREYEEGQRLYGWKPKSQQTQQLPSTPPASFAKPRTLPTELQ